MSRISRTMPFRRQGLRSKLRWVSAILYERTSMKSPDTSPKDGDFASYLEGKIGRPANAPDAAASVGANTSALAEAPRQTVQQVLVEGEEPTEEFLEEWNAVKSAPELSDEEFERQALDAPGEDGDPSTPE